MKENLIIVFVDALPFEEIARLSKSVRFLTWSRPLQPGFGYSVNVKSELFAGLPPDAAGFLNEWTYRPGQGIRQLRFPVWLWRVLARWRLLKRLVSKLLSKAIGEDLRNIPLPLLSSLVREGENAYESGYDRETLFQRHGLRRHLYTENGGDEGAFRSLCKEIEEASGPVRAFLAQCDLDHVMHKHGKGTPQYYETIARVDDRLATLWEMLSKRGGGRICLVSDHGMAPVTEYVRFDIEEAVPGISRDYGYFVDATMARVWARDERTRERVTQWLDAAGLPGRILSDDDRARWGITSAQFGDVIFLLDEGVMFAPNFFGDKGCKAMHGYWPQLDSQLGVLASSAPMKVQTNGGTVTAIGAFESLSRCAATG